MFQLLPLNFSSQRLFWSPSENFKPCCTHARSEHFTVSVSSELEVDVIIEGGIQDGIRISKKVQIRHRQRLMDYVTRKGFSHCIVAKSHFGEPIHLVLRICAINVRLNFSENRYFGSEDVALGVPRVLTLCREYSAANSLASIITNAFYSCGVSPQTVPSDFIACIVALFCKVSLLEYFD